MKIGMPDSKAYFLTILSIERGVRRMSASFFLSPRKFINKAFEFISIVYKMLNRADSADKYKKIALVSPMELNIH